MLVCLRDGGEDEPIEREGGGEERERERGGGGGELIAKIVSCPRRDSPFCAVFSDFRRIGFFMFFFFFQFLRRGNTLSSPHEVL